MQEKCKFLEEKGETFDYAYPVDWAVDVIQKTGMNVHGIVWLYDEQASIFGRPYAVTLYGWIVLRLYNLKLNSRSLL
jgi:hypothetical protein